MKRTERGFDIMEFTDRNGEKCSLQKSSLADEECIWLGIDKPTVKVLSRGEGWKDFPLPTGAGVSHNGRMHLTRTQVQELLPYLQHFAETGDLRKE